MAETRAVAKALLVADDKILLLRRSATDIRRPLQWDLPGGAIDPGEDIKQACAREVFEEAGIVIAVSDCKTIYAMTEPVADAMSASFIFFKAQVSRSEVKLSSEHDEARWVTLAEALELVTYERHCRLLTYVVDNALLSAATSD